MDLSNPLATVTPTLDARVLQVLVATTAPCTAAEIHRRMGHASDEGVRKVLGRLVGQGIVITHAPARYPLYWLNRDHVAAPAIVQLAHVRQELLARIVAAIEAWGVPALHASLFGSFARGEAGAESDIDVLTIRPRRFRSVDEEPWQGQITSLDESIRSWTGNKAQVMDLDQRTLATMVQRRDPLLESWRADAVHLAGERLLDVLRGSR